MQNSGGERKILDKPKQIARQIPITPTTLKKLEIPVKIPVTPTVVMTQNKGTIYLIKMCDTNQRCIYKIGKTINLDARFKSYHYYDILALHRSLELDYDEIELIKIFNFCNFIRI